MTYYSQSANPNATNSELDAKQIITNKLKTYHIECMETTTFIVEVEAEDANQARDFVNADVNKYEVIYERVQDYEINLVEEVL